MVPLTALRLVDVRDQHHHAARDAGARGDAGLVAIERTFHIGIFDPALGGDPLLFQHLFWFYSHPAVYIMILPGMGIVSEIIACFARRRIFGYKFMAGSILAIAFVGFLVWGHHMFVSGQSAYAGLVFGLLSFFVALPSAIKVFNWVATLRRGSITLRGADAVCARLHRAVHDGRAHRPVPRDARDRRARDRHVLRGGALPLHHGRRHGHGVPRRPALLVAEDDGPALSRRLGAAPAIIAFIGFNLTFFPLFIAGYLGMPRRYHEYPPEFQLLQCLRPAGAFVLAFGYLIPLVNLGWSMLYGRRASANPWNAQGLEWTVASPPPTPNFARPVRVEGEPYDYDPRVAEVEAADGAR